MKAYTYISEGNFELREKEKPVIIHERDAVVKVTLASICSSDLHIKHGSVPRAVPGITVGHEMVGTVEEIGSKVTNVKPGDRVTVNVETFCGDCFFCKNGFVNNCTDKNGGWALGCRIDGGQAEYVRVPFADQGLNKIPDSVTDRQALFVGDVLATGFWAARISEITKDETVVLLSHKKPDGHINVKVEFGEGEGKVPLDNIAKRAEEYKPKERVTYKMIKEYIEAKYGFKVHTAYIAEVKRDLGLPMYDAPNAVEELKQPRKHPTAEKVEAIKDALKHFEVI